MEFFDTGFLTPRANLALFIGALLIGSIGLFI